MQTSMSSRSVSPLKSKQLAVKLSLDPTHGVISSSGVDGCLSYTTSTSGTSSKQMRAADSNSMPSSQYSSTNPSSVSPASPHEHGGRTDKRQTHRMSTDMTMHKLWVNDKVVLHKCPSDASLQKARTSERITWYLIIAQLILRQMIPGNHAKSSTNIRIDFVEDPMTSFCIESENLFLINWVSSTSTKQFGQVARRLFEKMLHRISPCLANSMSDLTPIQTTSDEERVTFILEAWRTYTFLMARHNVYGSNSKM